MFEKEAEKYASDLELIYKKGELDGYNKCNYKLTEAKEIILTLLNTFAYPIGREDWTMEDIEVINRAEDFLKEE
jgi:hypothetical protein